MLRNSLLAISVLAVLVAACSDSPSAADLNQDPPATGGSSGGSGTQVTGGSSGSPSSSGSSTGGLGGGGGGCWALALAAVTPKKSSISDARAARNELEAKTADDTA